MSPRPNYNLVQLSVKSAEVAPEEFKTRTEAIRSCDQAVKLAAELDAQVTRNAYVRADQMPTELNAILKDLPTGQATPVFTNGGEVLRVLVLKTFRPVLPCYVQLHHAQNRIQLHMLKRQRLVCIEDLKLSIMGLSALCVSRLSPMLCCGRAWHPLVRRH